MDPLECAEALAGSRDPHVIALTRPARGPYNWSLSIALGGSMYAVIRSGGKQHRVAPGETIEVERLDGKVGGKVAFEDVIAVRTDDKKILGGEQAAKAKITGKIVKHLRGPKLEVMKFKTGGQYKIQRGHRQGLTAVEIGEIQLS
jgi:large subunit ribosomal protein L21